MGDTTAGCHSAAARVSSGRRRQVSRPGQLWDHRGRRTRGGVLVSGVVGTRRTRRPSWVREGTRAWTGCRAGRARQKPSVPQGTVEARPRVPAEGPRAWTRWTCCSRNYQSWAAIPRRAARAPEETRWAAQPKGAAAASCIPSGGHPVLVPAVVVVVVVAGVAPAVAVGASWEAACRGRERGPRRWTTCCGVGSVSRAASGRARGREDTVAGGSTGRTVFGRACRDTGRRWEEDAMRRAGMAAGRRRWLVSAGMRVWGRESRRSGRRAVGVAVSDPSRWVVRGREAGPKRSRSRQCRWVAARVGAPAPFGRRVEQAARAELAVEMGIVMRVRSGRVGEWIAMGAVIRM